MKSNEFSKAGKDLHQAVASRSSDPGVQMNLLTSLARTVGASGKDIEEVKAELLRGKTRECAG